MLAGLQQRPGLLLALVVTATTVLLGLAQLAGLSKTKARQKAEPIALVGTEDLPDFQRFSQASTRKAHFFAYLRPIIEAENQEIRRQRQRVKELAGRLKAKEALPDEDRRWLREMAGKYRVKTADRDLREIGEQLLKRVDTIPPSLVLAQAAKESAWGTSRFAQQGNNLFGQWCFQQGCGLVPARRGQGKTHEVEVFPHVRAAMASYMRNLNSHPKYETLRTIRAGLRREGEPVTGIALAGGLRHYSEQGMEYVASLRAMIRHNDLEQGNRGS